MKISALITAALFAALFAVACDDASETEEQAEAVESSDDASEAEEGAEAVESPDEVTAATGAVSLDLEGMTCVSCAANIEDALAETEGVASADVDFGARRADVEYDDTLLDTPDLIAVIEEAGFEAQPTSDAADDDS